MSQIARAVQGAALRGSLAASLTLVAASPTVSAQTCQPAWDEGFGMQQIQSPVGEVGLDNIVRALAVFDDGSAPALYAGGFFTTAGGVPASHIAKWDGSTWSPVGLGIGGVVNAMTVFDDGTGPALYVAGAFVTAGGAFADHIAKWDGSSWSQLGLGLNGIVNTLTTYDDGSGPSLIAGGSFKTAGGVAAPFIAKWNGSSWGPLSLGISGNVNTLAVYDDGTGPVLYAGGDFTTLDGSFANFIAQWNGFIWINVGGGVSSGRVMSLVVFDDGTGPALFAGGGFTFAGSISARSVAKWDGSTWSSLEFGVGGGSPADIVYSLAVYYEATGSVLVVGGNFATAGLAPANDIAKWDGAAWSAFGVGTNNIVRTLGIYDDGFGPSLYAGGDFTTTGGVTSNRIGKWNGLSWFDVQGAGVSADVSSLQVFDDGTGAALYAGGNFALAGNSPAHRVGRFDGLTWSALGVGVNADVAAFEVFNDGAGDALYAAGAFSTAGGIPASKIAKWDGAGWSALGAGFNGDVHALSVFDDGTGASLYSGGDFTMTGSLAANHIAKWDGQAWTAVGAGLDDSVFSLRVFDDGTGPALYAGGVFTVAGSVPANMIARWDGVAWSAVTNGAVPLAAPPEVVQAPAVLTLEVFDDGAGEALYAGGSFTVIDNVVARRMARWDGANWTPLGNGMSDPVRSLAVFDDAFGPALYAGGDFATAGTAVAAHVAKWSAGAWSAVDAGTNGPVKAMLAMFDPAVDAESLFAGGSFTSAGGLPSSNIGRFAGCPTPPDTFLLVDPADGSVGAILTPTLTWEASMGAITFELKVGTNPDLTTGLLIDETGLTGTSFTIADGVLTQGVVYYWGVTAVNGTGQTPSSQGVFSFTTAPLGDFNFDGTVNGSDLATMLTNWGPCSAPPATCPADIAGAGDGDVNGADLATLLTNWGTP